MMVRLTTVTNSIDANFLQQQLQMEGIESFTTNENTSELLPYLNGLMGQGIQIMVHKDDFEKARAIMEDCQKRNTIVTCPYCGSENIDDMTIGNRKWTDQLAIILALIFVVPVGPKKPRQICRDCGKDFA